MKLMHMLPIASILIILKNSNNSSYQLFLKLQDTIQLKIFWGAETFST